MTKGIISKFKQILAFVLIVVMTTPTMIHATNPYDEEAAIWADLPVIEPLDIDLSQFPELAELLAKHSPSMPEGISAFGELTAELTAEELEAFNALTTEEQYWPVYDFHQL